MKLKKDDVITLDNGNDYLVVDITDFNSLTYAYLTNMDDNNEDDRMIQRITINDDGYELHPLENEDEFNTLIEVFYNRNKKEFEEE